MTPIFILGISQRSGTNLLYRMMLLHPECSPSAGPPEDHLASYFHYLDRFHHEVSSRWNPKWDPEVRRSFATELRSQLANGVARALQPSEQTQVFVTKTPSPKGLDVFFDVMADARVVILLRDGRDVVLSGVAGGFWRFDDGTRSWARDGRLIAEFVRGNGWSSDRHVVVRYEDLVLSPERAIRPVLELAGLDSDTFPFDELDALPVFNSSFRDDQSTPVWRTEEKRPGFKPVGRSTELTAHECARFDWLAGDVLRELGYDSEVEPLGAGSAWRNRAADIEFGVRDAYREFMRLRKAAARSVRRR